MTTKAKPQAVHSPLPWRVVPYGEQSGINGIKSEILDAAGETVADNENYYPQAVMPEDQALIVTAVNSHAALVEACSKVLRAIKWGTTDERMTDDEKADMLRAALELAGEEI